MSVCPSAPSDGPAGALRAAAARTGPPAARTGPPADPAAVLFDMDGLLVDTEPLWFEAETAVMARMGGGWTHADQRRLVGSTLDRAMVYMHARAPRPPAEPEEIGQWLVDAMVHLITSRRVGLLPGAGPLLAQVAGAGLAHALVTSAQRRIMDAVITATGVSFPVAVCGEDVQRGKPDPEPYLRAAALLGAAPDRCVVLEDSPVGVAAAEAAGCAVIVVPNMPGLDYPERPERVAVTSLSEVTLDLLREAMR